MPTQRQRIESGTRTAAALDGPRMRRAQRTPRRTSETAAPSRRRLQQARADGTEAGAGGLSHGSAADSERPYQQRPSESESRAHRQPEAGGGGRGTRDPAAGRGLAATPGRHVARARGRFNSARLFESESVSSQRGCAAAAPPLLAVSLSLSSLQAPTNTEARSGEWQLLVDSEIAAGQPDSGGLMIPFPAPGQPEGLRVGSSSRAQQP